MGGKKKAGGKGKKKGGDDDEINVGTLNMILQAQVESMQQKIVLEQERCANGHDQIEQSRLNEEKLDERLEKHKKETREKIRDMTIMYRSMEKELTSLIKEKETRVETQEEEKRRLKEEIDQLKKDTQEMINEKDGEIRE